MKIFKKISAGFLLTVGVICLIAGAYAPFDPETKKEERLSTAIACLLFGLPLTGTGAWIVWGLRRDWQQEVENRLLSTFYQLLKQGHGKITVLRFSMEAQLPQTLAKQYLDEKAKEFNASFMVTEEGVVLYDFPEYLES